jgi:hypothetical protein
MSELDEIRTKKYKRRHTSSENVQPIGGTAGKH